MIWLCVGFLVSGLVVGFLLARSHFQRIASPEQQQALTVMAADAEVAKKQLSQLQQDKADLTYQLGEAQKSLSYNEQRMAKLQKQLKQG